MQKKEVINKVKLGVFVTGGVIIFAALIFYVGSNNYKFGAQGKHIVVVFKNVTGLRHGSLVRYSGVNIGTVDHIKIITDSTVEVTLSIDAKSSEFIKTDSKAKVSTEGILGNRFISITAGSKSAAKIEDGSKIESIEPLDFDNVLLTLNETGIHAKNITSNLDNITKKIDNGEGTLGALITDREILDQAGKMFTSFQRAGDKTNLFADKMTTVADSLGMASSNAIRVSENLETFTDKLNNDSSSLGKVISDTVMAKRMDRALIDVSSTAEDVKLTSGKIRENWFIRHFGKKPKKEPKPK